MSAGRRRLLAHGLALIVAGAGLSSCTEVESSAVEGYEPAHLNDVKGSEYKSVTFTKEGARRTDLQTALVQRAGGKAVVPYAALIYDAEGRTYVYTSPRPLTFMRTEVRVDRIRGRRAWLADGPAPGTAVVTVGAAQVYGTELEIAGSH